MPLKVVYYTHTFFLDPALLLARALSKKCELHLFVELTPSNWNSALFDIPRRDMLRNEIIPGETLLDGAFPEGIRAYWRDAASFQFVVHKHTSAFNPQAFLLSNQAARAISKLKPDIIHLDEIFPKFAMGLLSLARIPIVLNIHDPKRHEGEESRRIALAQRIIKPRVAQYVLFNRSLREHFCGAFSISPQKVSTTHLGIYDIYREWAKPDLIGAPFDILFFGRLSPYKGLDVLFSALEIVSREKPSLKAIIAGKPIPGYKIPALPQLSNGGSIQILDRYINNYELADLFQRAKLVACPYVDATQSGVVLTAYAFNKPVVASDIGGLGEYVSERTGALTAPGDPSALAEKILAVLSDPAAPIRFQNGIEDARIGELSWDSAADDILKIYQLALAK
jgi:glycosyltransferase involved in cell wall biosynthesis